MVRSMIYSSPDLPEHEWYYGREGPRQQNHLLVAPVWRMPVRNSSSGFLRAFPAVGGRSEQKARREDERRKWGLSRMPVLPGWLIFLVSPKDGCTCPIWTIDPYPAHRSTLKSSSRGQVQMIAHCQLRTHHLSIFTLVFQRELNDFTLVGGSGQKFFLLICRSKKFHTIQLII